MYSIDTNIFLDWWERRYPPDVFPALKQSVERLSSDGKLYAPEGVWTEIQHVGSTELKAWAKQNRKIFLPHDQNIQIQANQIQDQFPGLIDANAYHDEADRYVIALAKNKGFTVVTHETSARSKKRPPRSHYIPDVCAALNIKCIELVELMRREKWSF
ncbi:MAG TPA: hypothetical protein DD725_05705 [Deltaproteobacteria bacterium]|nr:hypothetical protein [Deltaproteobacteria bacterium]